MPATSVKFIHSAMTGAPSMTGQVGSLIAVLDACLVDGFALKSVDSLVVAGNVATMNISTGHSFEVGTVALIAGAAPAGLNGEQRITAVTTNTASFATTGLANQTATGSITAKLAPLGWEKPFSGTNLGVYRSADVTGNRHFLRVDDNYTTDPRDARLVSYEDMTGVSTGTGPAPTVAQAALGAFITKSIAATSLARSWVFFGDEKMFYLSINYGLSSQTATYFYGEPIGLKTPDPYNTVLGASTGSSVSGAVFSGSVGEMGGGASPSSWSQSDNIVHRSSTGIGTARSTGRVTAGGLATGGSGGLAVFPYPNSADNALLFTEILMRSEGSFRARFPGVYFVPQNLVGAFSTRDVVIGSGVFSGKRFVFIQGGGSQNEGFFFDQLGPWR